MDRTWKKLRRVYTLAYRQCPVSWDSPPKEVTYALVAFLCLTALDRGKYGSHP